MNTEKTYTDIERYLDGTLPEIERADFQARLASDEAFAKEVALHRKLHRTMEDPKKVALRNSLEGLSQEFMDTQPAPKVVPIRSKYNLRLIWSVAASILLFGFALWFFLKKPAVTDKIVKEKTPLPIEENAPEKIREVRPEKVIPDLKKEEAVVKKEPTVKIPPKTKENPIPKPTPVDYYQENEELMAALEGIDPQGTHQFTMSLPKEGETVSIVNGQVNLVFKGQLKSFDYSETDEYTVAVFNNQKNTFRNNKAFSVISLPLVKIEQDEEIFAQSGGSLEEFNFSLTENLPLPLGRYYYVIRLSSDTEVLAGGVFMVK